MSKIHTIIDKMLLPLRRYDDENNTQLLLTFKELLKSDLNITAVSKKMFLHRNTILQRKNKIIEIFGFDPFLFPCRTQFEIALILNSFIKEKNWIDTWVKEIKSLLKKKLKALFWQESK